jgi:hypothetical protein
MPLACDKQLIQCTLDFTPITEFTSCSGSFYLENQDVKAKLCTAQNVLGMAIT